MTWTTPGQWVAASADVTPPNLTLIGGAIALSLGEEYIEQGFTAIDDVDGDIKSRVLVTLPDFTTEGAKVVTYDAYDIAGNTTIATRSVTVGSVNAKPSVVINAPATLTVNGEAQLSATITDDPEDTHTLQWGVSAGSFDDATSATPTVTAPATAQTITYTLTVTDNNGLASDEATATTSVTELQAFSPTKSRPIKVDRRLKVSKTDGFELDINKWLEGEAITSFQVVTPDGKTSVVSTSESGGIMRVLLKGIEKGAAEVHFEYATATGRDDCTVMLVIVVDDC